MLNENIQSKMDDYDLILREIYKQKIRIPTMP
jgi:hypothetical protein